MSTRAIYRDDDVQLEINNKWYRVDVEAEASYYYSPGRMYMRNGDPGYPPDESFDIDDIYATWYEMIGDSEDEIEVTPTREMEDVLEDYLKDLDRWTFDSDDSYYYDYPDERD